MTHHQRLTDITECIQMRVEMSKDAVVDYQDALRREGIIMPPVKAARDKDGGIYVWDGNHTVEAARRNGEVFVLAAVEAGTRKDAVLRAAGANRDHGLRRTREDLRNALRVRLNDPTWASRSDDWLAKTIGCSYTFVAKWRKQLGTCSVSSERETADGRVVNTKNYRQRKPRGRR